MNGLTIFQNNGFFSENKITKEEIDNYIIDFWNSIDAYGFEFFEENFENIADGLLVFLCFSSAHFDKIQCGTYQDGEGDFGSHITFDQYDREKQLNLKLNKDKQYLIELILIDDFEWEEKVYSKKIEADKVPNDIKKILINVNNGLDPKDFSLKDL